MFEWINQIAKVTSVGVPAYSIKKVGYAGYSYTEYSINRSDESIIQRRASFPATQRLPRGVSLGYLVHL